MCTRLIDHGLKKTNGVIKTNFINLWTLMIFIFHDVRDYRLLFLKVLYEMKGEDFYLTEPGVISSYTLDGTTFS